MNIIYQYPIGQINPHLFPVLEKEFEKMGIGSTTNPEEATHCFLNLLSGNCEYDNFTLTALRGKGIPFIIFDDREYGEMSGVNFYPDVSDADIYFVRNLCGWAESNNVHPFDWPYFNGCDYAPTTKDELFSREYDVCLISCESPTRKNLIDGIIKDGRLKVNHQFLEKRLPYSDWVNEHRKAKLYISADGGGYTNERPNQLFSVAALLKNRSQHIPAEPFTDLINCIEINEHPTKEDVDKILSVVNDKEWLYEIYTKGIEHMKTNCSPEAVAKRILSIINP